MAGLGVLVAVVLTLSAASASANQAFEQGKVSLTFDDGWETQYTLALPLLRAHGLRGVFYLTTGAVGTWPGVMDEAQVQELADDGHELQSHTVRHPDLTAISGQELENELVESRRWLRERFGDDAGRHVAAPYGRVDDEAVGAARPLYASLRGVGPTANWRDADVYALSAFDVHHGIDPRNVRDWLEQAMLEGSWVILTFHELADGDPTRSTQLRTADLAQILADIETLGIEVVGVDETVRLMTGDEGGTEDEGREVSRAGGCRAGNTGVLALLLAVLWVWRRRAGSVLLAALVCLITACGSGGEAGHGTDDTESEGDPAVRFIGRFDRRDAKGPLAAWPGTRVIAVFEGTHVAATLEEVTLSWQQSGPSELDVAVDGVWQDKLVLRGGSHTYALADDLPPGRHTVELFRRSEAQSGLTRFVDLDFAGGTLLPPPRHAAVRLEIIGDSASSGFGVEGVGLGPDCPGADWAARYQNFRLAWGTRLGERLDAEVHATIYSGKGVVRNIWRADPMTMPRIYPRANPYDATSIFDVDSFVPHAVLIMLGGNDFQRGLPTDDGPLSGADFEAGLDAFLDDLRAAYAEAHILLVLSPSAPAFSGPTRVVRADLRDALRNVADTWRSAGDARVHFVEPAPATDEELRGCNRHGTPEFHDRLAAELEPLVRELL